MRKSLLFVLCFVVFIGCQQKQGGFQTYFWCSTETAAEQYLYIDGEEQGVLPYLPVAPVCENDFLKQQALSVFLPSGKYEIAIRDAKGKLQYEEVLKLKRRLGSTSIGSSENWRGVGSRRTFQNDCLIEEIRYE